MKASRFTDLGRCMLAVGMALTAPVKVRQLACSLRCTWTARGVCTFRPETVGIEWKSSGLRRGRRRWWRGAVRRGSAEQQGQLVALLGRQRRRGVYDSADMILHMLYSRSFS